jgi:hypothetical protein
MRRHLAAPEQPLPPCGGGPGLRGNRQGLQLPAMQLTLGEVDGDAAVTAGERAAVVVALQGGQRRGGAQGATMPRYGRATGPSLPA